MFVTAIKADKFKNLENVLIEPHPKYNIITGMNAQGKTNLLESIWLMTGCRSFRGSKDKDHIGIGKPFMEIGIGFDDGRRVQTIDYRMSRENIRKKDITLNGVNIKGTNGLFDAFKAVIFTPDDTELIKGSPERRRTFTDLCCCQINPRCLDLVRRFDLIMEHRNNLLKAIAQKGAASDTMEIWDSQAAVVGTLLSVKRAEYIEKFSKECTALYSMITEEREELTIEYNSNVFGSSIPEKDEAAALYLSKLNSHFSDDVRLGYTLCGAHRDDLVIKINGMSIKDFGSQGQKKTAALVMKLAQAQIYYRDRNEAPVILLDDVMGELDESRQRLVFEVIKDMQVFITACNENSVTELSEGKIFTVKNGQVKERR